MMMVWPSKDSDEVTRREIDWESHPAWQLGDTISSSSFSLSTAAGMSIDSNDDDSLHTSWVILTGGTEGLRGKVLGEVVTANGQTLQQTATILIETR